MSNLLLFFHGGNGTKNRVESGEQIRLLDYIFKEYT